MSFNLYVGIVILCIIVGVIGYYSYSFYSSYYKVSDKKEDTDTIHHSDKTPELMFFYADWCGHCKKAKPEWESTKEYLHNNLINSHRVFCVDYNCSDKTPETSEILNKYKIDGFPTIKLQYDNTIYEFNDVPTKDNILLFLNNSIQ
jgi:thiol-disulfide isomerase/thioredoxin